MGGLGGGAPQVVPTVSCEVLPRAHSLLDDAEISDSVKAFRLHKKLTRTSAYQTIKSFNHMLEDAIRTGSLNCQCQWLHPGHFGDLCGQTCPDRPVLSVVRKG